MYNKSKTHQSLKTEKENENINLRKKFKCFSTDTHVTNKRETVWDRLSKIKKVSSTENILKASRSRSNLSGRTLQRLTPPLKQSIQTTRKPLIPCIPINKSSSLPQKLCRKKSYVPPEFDNSIYWPLAAGNEAHDLDEGFKPLSNAKVSFNKLNNTPAERSRSIDQKESSEDSTEEYILAPLMTSYSEDGTQIRMRNVNSVCEFLRENKSMAFEDVELVRDVIKSDSRCENLEKNPKVLKDILKGQLQNILMHEFAVQKALNSLESSVSLQQSIEIKSMEPTNKIVSYLGHNNETQKLEVDVIFKNVPSLDKEIEILRALGEKLEATLKTTTSHRTVCNTGSQTPMAPAKNKQITQMFKLKYEIYHLTTEYHAQVLVCVIGIRYCLGAINEFCMAQKSIIELKRESNRPFYIPSNSESIQLVKTSFKKLKETPNELLRHVKPKNSQVAFNVLEQDPVFFYNAFNKLPNIQCLFASNYNHYEEYRIPIKQTFFKNDESSHFWNSSIQEVPQNDKKFLADKKESKNINSFNFKSESGEGTDNKCFNTRTILEPLIRGKQRRRIRRQVTPMPVSNYHCPKNSLFKTVFVGFAQMSVFIVLIMALTYPDLRC